MTELFNVKTNTINYHLKEIFENRELEEQSVIRKIRTTADVIRNWLRNRETLEFLSTWEYLNNDQFKVFEFEHFKKQVGLLTFTHSVSE